MGVGAISAAWQLGEGARGLMSLEQQMQLSRQSSTPEKGKKGQKKWKKKIIYGEKGAWWVPRCRPMCVLHVEGCVSAFPE